MSLFLKLFSPLWGKLLGWAAKSVFLSGFLGALAPLISGFATLIGGIVTAVSEILVSLSKSPEGRVVLAILGAATAFLYLRFHYIEEGRASVQPRHVAISKPCPSGQAAGRKR